MARTTPRRAVPAPYGRRPRWRRPLTVLTVIAVLLAGGGYAAYSAYKHYVVKLLTVPGCQAGLGKNAIPLDFGQASDAAVIAGVAVREHLPRQALTIAYATTLQESKLENPSYGDLDSVGIFQQRPSQGWGSAAQLQDPAFATAAFFAALVKVPGWDSMPVYQAAQAVQRSADGSAYQQYAQTGALLAADYTAEPHAVTCWYDPAAQASSLGVSTKPNFTGAVKSLTDAFGPMGPGGAVRSFTAGPEAGSHLLNVTASSGWPVAYWLVANAGNYGITQVRYKGFRWKAGLTETSWQADPGGVTGSIVTS